MFKILRKLTRVYLGWLTTRTLQRHQPFVAVVLGRGPTSIVREMAFSLIKEKYLTRKNDEVLESEFSIPLAVLGHEVYPHSYLEWVIILIRYTLQLFWISPVDHALVLEIPLINEQIQRFWLQKLHPQVLLQVGDSVTIADLHPVKISAPTESGLWEEVSKFMAERLKLTAEDVEVARLTLELPDTNIRAYKLKSGQLLIDATYQYYPPAEGEVDELVKQLNSNREVIILRGQKAEVLPSWREQLRLAMQII
jgi:hypothetical protein